MREPVGGADDKSVERVAPVEAGSTGGGGVGGVWSFGEVGRPALLGITDDFAVFFDPRRCRGIFPRRVLRQRRFQSLWRCAAGNAVVVRIVRRGSDADPELDLLSESAAECVGDRRTQMTFDLILYKAARNRQQSKPLDDGERLDEVEPGSLLGSQRSDESGAIGGQAVRCGFAIELGDNRVPHCGEA